MIDVLLVNPPVARYDVAELAPPLSLLTLAASLRAVGRDVTILDLNLPAYREAADTPSKYFDKVTEVVASFQPREIGITSMGVNTHVTLQLAATLAQEIAPSVTIGGIHVSTISEALQAELPPGVRIAPTRRNLRGTEWWNSPQPYYKAKDLFLLDLDPYFEGNPRRVANWEASYGCKYHCAFCYSPSTFGKWANNQIDWMIEDLATLTDLGFYHTFLVGDNLTNDPKWLIALTKALEASQIRLTWNGYATLPDLTTNLIELAAAAGCINLYIGIDVVEPDQQRAWGKRFLGDRSHLYSLLHTARSVGLQLTCAFILDIDPASDYATTVTLDVAAQASLMGADTRLSVITPYPQTELFEFAVPMEYSELRTAILMDLPQVVVTNALAQRHLALFPWHACPKRIADTWEERIFAVHAAQVVLHEGLAPSIDGHLLWEHSLAIARAEANIGAVHKTELKAIVRKLSAALSRAA